MTAMILPVIHYADHEQALRNAQIAFDAGCPGVFLIHMGGANHLLKPAAQEIKTRWPDRKVGINHLGVDPLRSLDMNLSNGLDMTWTDDQLTHTSATSEREARQVHALHRQYREHLLFVGVAFKHQRAEPRSDLAARRAEEMGFIPTTSGPATGSPADLNHIEAVRRGLRAGSRLAIASGITPDNAQSFLPSITHMLVATGISSSFHEFDESLLKKLNSVTI